jgi:hypothetical protein
MSRRSDLLLRRIVLALGAAPVACGGTTAAPPEASDAASVSEGSIEMRDSSVVESDGSTADGAQSADLDGSRDAAADGGQGLGVGGGDASGDGALLITVRRPFLVGTSLRAARATAGTEWLAALRERPAAVACERTRAALARAWRDDALQEHASVAAFARFSMFLLSLGAPPDLVAASQRASLDEIRHARACFALAAAYGGGSVGPGALWVADSVGPLTIAEVAALTAEEGCVGETLGVVLATCQLEGTVDPVVKALLETVVADEARHAELAWRFVGWAATRDPAVLPAVEAATARAIAAVRSSPIRAYDVDAATWRAHGRLTCAEARRASEAGIVDVIQPAVSALRRAGSSDRAGVARLG